MIYLRTALAVFLVLTVTTTQALAGPTVVPTAEGQIGEMPGASDQLLGTQFESIRGQRGDVVLGSVKAFGGATPPPPEIQFLTDRIHGPSNPMPVSSNPSLFQWLEKLGPNSSYSLGGDGMGPFIVFSYAIDGGPVDSITVRIDGFDENGTPLFQGPIAEDIPTFTIIPDPRFAKTGVAVDNQGRATVAYTELSMAGLPRVRATRADVTDGTIIDFDFLINDNIRGNPDVALLDPAGNRLIIATEELTANSGIKGNIVDLTGGTPVIMPEFPVNDTPVTFITTSPVVAADPAIGNFLIAWEDFTGTPGDPSDVRARRFDATGNPVGSDIIVNTTTANSQAQPSVAYGPENLSAVAWVSDTSMPMGIDDLDVFLQVYDPSGNPIGGEVKVNTFETNTQDKPAVRFLPDRDAQGRPQVAVVWRDVGNSGGFNPRGTGTSYRCFSITGFEEQVPIFADGFESGDTTSWSDTTP